ncbi:hypothetical protein TanjilG_09512 [Lupinus angustifolius]|uniref:Uncharacterized protein n=2 Tax=Lupinus angustifolius TaxID=3871 RepID=A0A1J7FV72_LUPAN|nr:hypothetical protein TanjilG_09512 [Lupinus angustifolius]
MSNTLILIIVADYGAFSSSKKKNDLYEEYVLHGQQRNHDTTSYVSKYEQVDKQCIEMGGKFLHEKKKTINDESLLKGPTISREISLLSTEHEDIMGNQEKHSKIIPERVLEIVAQDKPKKASECSNYKKSVLSLKVDDGYKEFEEKVIHARIGRSKSDRYRRDRVKSVVVDERKQIVTSSKTMEVEEENEFSKMTNEDLNKRVEEFIQKFNRQIRLQATRKNNQI